MVDFADPRRASRVAGAIAEAHPDAAFLILCEEAVPDLPERSISRCVRWPEFLRVDLNAEVHRLEAQRRVHRLRRFARGVRVLPILVQPDADPDAISSAMALRVLLRRNATDSPIVSLGDITRPENRRMAALLKVQVTRIDPSELASFEKIAAVDTLPRNLPDDAPGLAVIDHHPLREGYAADVLDVRPEYGATATMLTEYLRTDDARRIRKRLATALLYGIKTDTNSLSRGVIPADVVAYAFLQARADPELLRRIERPGYPRDLARDFGRALRDMVVEEDVAVAFMRQAGEDHVHVLADLADFLLDMEGIRWSAASTLADGNLVVKLRHLGGGEAGAGELARRLTASSGSGGGHASMAQAVVPVEAVGDDRLTSEGADGAEQAAAVHAFLEPELSKLRTPEPAEPKGKNRRAVAASAAREDGADGS